jgi:hypothetical protein
MPEISVYPASIYSIPLDYWLTKSTGTILNSFSWTRRDGGQEVRNHPPSSTALLAFQLSSGSIGDTRRDTDEGVAIA